MNKKISKGFTLVELIVVITILAILWTIGFLSFQWYSSSARDSSRIADISGLIRLMEYKKQESWQYPRPDNSITITASGQTVWFQWTAERWVFAELLYSWDWLDPLDQNPYTYYVLNGDNEMQILGLMENISAVASNTMFTDSFSNFGTRSPKLFWNKLWIITDTDNTPANTLSWATNIDIVQTPDTYIAHIDNTTKYTWMGNDLRYSVPKSSCQRLADLNLGWANGYYTIYPIDDIPTEVYCRFENGEWYTLVAKSVNNPSFNNTPFGWFVSRWSPRNDSEPYSLGAIIQDIPFKSIYLEVAWVRKDRSTTPGLDSVTILDVTDVDFFTSTNLTNPIAVNNCTWWGCALFSNWGNFWSQESYYFSPTTTNLNSISDLSDLTEYSGSQWDGLNTRRYGSTFPYPGVIYVK